MRKIIQVFTILCFIPILLFGSTNRYSIKSGIIEYDILGEDSISKDETVGASKLFFKDFGNIELIDETTTYTNSKLQEEEQESERVIYKMLKDKQYVVDFNDEIIYSQKIELDEENSFLSIKNREAFIQMGAKFIGNEAILGFNCEVWELGSYKTWVYKGITLKQISKIDSKTQMIVARSAKFNIDIKDSNFKLPKFPIKAIDIIINQEED